MAQNETKSQRTLERVYAYIKEYISKNAISPSVRDICTGVGLKSTSSVHTYLKKLDESGIIEYRPGMRRAIIIKNMEDLPAADITPLRDDCAKVYCLGKITAGEPILANEDYSETFYINRSIIGNNDCFMLKVRGNSMIDAHILDGDYIIVRKQEYCDEGDIIAALIDDEATVKRFGKLNGQPYLFPENEQYSPIPFNKEDCRILGKVVGLHRYSIS